MAAGDASVEKILADNTYRYNKNGQRTEKTTLAGTTKYMYDVLGQLIQENNHIYTYDRAGNRTSVQTDDRREIYHYDRGRLRNRTVERQQDPAGSVGVYVPRVPGKMRQKKGVNRHERTTEIRYGRIKYDGKCIS